MLCLESRAEKWRELCCNSDLLGKDVAKLHNHTCVCEKHFSNEQFTNATHIRLNLNAIPNRFLPLQSSFIHATSASVDVSCLADESAASSSHHTDILMPCHSMSTTSTPGAEIATAESIVSPSSTLSAVVTCTSTGNVLTELGISPLDLTPKKRRIYKEFCKKKKEVMRLRRVISRGKSRRKQEGNEGQKNLLARLEKDLSPAGYSLITSVINETQKQPRGRRWSASSKLVALSLLKKGPKMYRHLRTLFPLPSRSTLLPLLHSVPFHTGLNKDMLAQMAESVSRFRSVDKVCILMFDEMAIKPLLSYNSNNDIIYGFVDRGCQGRTCSKAHQAMVFLVRSLGGNWKQPVAYYFSPAATHATVLADLLREVLHALIDMGLTVVATVCDMGRNNVKALKLLGARYHNPFFSFEGHDIYTVFDPPHLLKCFRNLFLKYDILVELSLGGEQVTLRGSWSHIRALVAHLAETSPFDPISRLTEKHLDPNTFQKMKVCLAAEIFSRTVGSGIEIMVAKNKLGIDALATSDFVLEVDRMFDSLNGDSSHNSSKKVLTHSISEGSLHFSYWEEAMGKVEKWKFFNGTKVISPPSQRGWVATMKAVVLLWQKLKDLGFTQFNAKRINQDPIENLFNVVRQNCGGNSRPNAEQFISALKTAVVNGLFSCKNKGNTAPDDCNLLTDLRNFFYEGHSPEIENPIIRGPFDYKIKKGRLRNIRHIGSLVVSTVQGKFKCEHCFTDLTTSQSSSDAFIYSFCYDGDGELCGNELLAAVHEGISAVKRHLGAIAHEEHLSMLCTPVIHASIAFNFITCPQHGCDVKTLIASIIAQVAIKQFCVEQNEN